MAAHDRWCCSQRRPSVAARGHRQPGAFERWFAERGVLQVQVEEHALHLPLEPEQAWLIVVGSGWRGLLEQHPTARREEIREEFLDEIVRRGVDGVDATTLVAQGQRK